MMIEDKEGRKKGREEEEGRKYNEKNNITLYFV